MQILPIWISPDNQTIKVPNYIEGNKKDGEITFGGNLITNKNAKIGTDLKVGTELEVEKNINLKGDSLKIKGITNSTPVGVIVSYLGTSDPDGWVICDGQTRSYQSKYDSLLNLGIGSRSGGSYVPPDLTNRFLKHTEVKQKNNTPTVTLTNEHLPSHSHSGTTGTMNQNWNHSHGVNDPGHSHEYSKAWHKMPQSGRSTWCLTDFINDITRPSQTGISIQGTDTNHTHNFTTNPTGNGSSFTVPDPLFYGVKFIVKY
jgi:hypothetical protein